ncbi:hypothetical protein RJT34_28863 [Clitoria ternatea]|uniref:Uncharacterized protein n=1 Tax=Clitoria ternatea TaxID=43366 RepID=A0AAN9F9W8_CLITE
MGRAPCCDKNGLKKGPWTPEEDLMLINYIQTNGPGNWRTLPKNAGLQRCGKSCRLRWTNYLRPDIKRGRFSFEEEETIIQLHSVLGNKWSAIAARLPGRTDNEIKNYWNTHIRKRLLRMGIDPVTHAPRLDLLDMSSILRTALGNSSFLNLHGLLGAQALVNPELLKLAATATLLSLKNENPSNLVSQNLQQINAGNCHVQSQSQQVTPQEIMNQFQTQTQVSPENSIPSCLGETMVAPQNQIDLLHDQELVHYFNNGNQNMGYESVLSTPLSNSTPLNSSSTYVNSSTEEERDTYCSDVFKLEIPESFDINDFLTTPIQKEAFDWGSGIYEDASKRSSDGFQGNNGVIESGYGSSFSLVLDRERGELVEAPVKLERKGVSTERAIEALKSHSEAERRRRARITAHLDTLHSLIPAATKMDKASLLGEVIRHLKELKKNAGQACEDLMIPKDNDEISVEEQGG